MIYSPCNFQYFETKKRLIKNVINDVIKSVNFPLLNFWHRLTIKKSVRLISFQFCPFKGFWDTNLVECWCYRHSLKTNVFNKCLFLFLFVINIFLFPFTYRFRVLNFPGQRKLSEYPKKLETFGKNACESWILSFFGFVFNVLQSAVKNALFRNRYGCDVSNILLCSYIYEWNLKLLLCFSNLPILPLVFLHNLHCTLIHDMHDFFVISTWIVWKLIFYCNMRVGHKSKCQVLALASKFIFQG